MWAAKKKESRIDDVTRKAKTSHMHLPHLGSNEVGRDLRKEIESCVVFTFTTT